MNITLKLFASLTDYLPVESKYTNMVTLNVAEGTTIGNIIERHSLPPKWVHLVLVNGVYIYPEQRAKHILVEDDVLAIWPPIAGG
jgi:sulfur carrier protein ThiS